MKFSFPLALLGLLVIPYLIWLGRPRGTFSRTRHYRFSNQDFSHSWSFRQTCPFTEDSTQSAMLPKATRTLNSPGA